MMNIINNCMMNIINNCVARGSSFTTRLPVLRVFWTGPAMIVDVNETSRNRVFECEVSRQNKVRCGSTPPRKVIYQIAQWGRAPILLNFPEN
jgi:hypothetical protein